MARTKASVGAKVASGKSNKATCSVAPTSSSSSGSSKKIRSYTGGNPACPRDTPKWQKPITHFFACKDLREGNGAGSSAEIHIDPESNKSNRNIIESDEGTEKPSNRVLDETIELEPLNGDDSHKIEEYYPKNGEKGKGKGKKAKKEENNNVDRASKRELECEESDIISETIKRIKV